ncbi:hypothetical protein JMJ35_004741 [Cladonia borealis]|uniref:Uncharacterized protein n=1 Tax=Cladonia borealis TaxID=184061 RepID=A0AA39R2P2_9LECA|nr:hypothetical protein JMJ35_004741 [Cladonia borealis]
MSATFSGADAGIIIGSFSGLLLLCEIVRRIEERHQVHASDRQELPVYRENCQPENTGQDQGVIQDNGPHLAEQNDESFDEDARTIVGEENESDGSKCGVAEAVSQGLTKDNGQNMTEKNRKTFDEVDGTITVEEKDLSSGYITEEVYCEEYYGVPKNEGQHSTRKSLGEGNEWTSVELNEGYPGR